MIKEQEAELRAVRHIHRALSNGQRSHLETLTWQTNLEMSSEIALACKIPLMKEFEQRWCNSWQAPIEKPEEFEVLVASFGPSLNESRNYINEAVKRILAKLNLPETA